MWGLRSLTPRGRTESCTLRILSDAFTGAHGEGERHNWRKKKEEKRWPHFIRTLPPVAQPHLYKLCRRVRCHPAFLTASALDSVAQPLPPPCLIFTVNNFFLKFDFYQNPPSKHLFLQ